MEICGSYAPLLDNWTSAIGQDYIRSVLTGDLCGDGQVHRPSRLPGEMRRVEFKEAERVAREAGDRIRAAYHRCAEWSDRNEIEQALGRDWRVEIDWSDSRGSTISLTRWEGQRAVAALVYAPLYPDDRGDLLTWEENQASLLRNGRLVGWTDGRGEEPAVVLTSPEAELAVAEYFERCAPDRFRTIPSLAYRLALVAAGEADGTVGEGSCLAGRAMVQAQGGVIFNRDGVWIAGQRAVAERLARRCWTNIRPDCGSADCSRTTGRRVSNPDLLDRAHGLLLGQLAGDALGSLVEFKTGAWIEGRYPNGPRRLVDGGTYHTLAGQPTDDSELALALARQLLSGGGYDQGQVLEAYGRWYRSSPFDIGNTTRAAFGFGMPDAKSQANGSLMRCSPLALAAWSRADQLRQWAEQDSALSHPHPVCVDSCQVFTAALAAGLAGASKEGMWQIACRAATRPETMEALQNAGDCPPENFQTQMGWCLIALQNAFYELLHAAGPEEGIVATVRRGGDSDTNGCIAGALLGSHWGRSAMPGQWLRAILSCRPTRAFALCQRPRPREYWPADALELAEQLACLGG